MAQHAPPTPTPTRPRAPPGRIPRVCHSIDLRVRRSLLHARDGSSAPAAGFRLLHPRLGWLLRACYGEVLLVSLSLSDLDPRQCSLSLPHCCARRRRERGGHRTVPAPTVPDLPGNNGYAPFPSLLRSLNSIRRSVQPYPNQFCLQA